MNKFLNPECEKCGHFNSGGNCLLSNTPVDKEGSCKHYTESPYICEMCGKHLYKEAVSYTTGDKSSHHLLCLQCYALLDTCNTCVIAQKGCKFEDDISIPESKYVMRQIQQGPMITQIQVKNPKRINLTCKVNCPCFINGECIRENGSSCDKYECSVQNW